MSSFVSKGSTMPLGKLRQRRLLGRVIFGVALFLLLACFLRCWFAWAAPAQPRNLLISRSFDPGLLGHAACGVFLWAAISSKFTPGCSAIDLLWLGLLMAGLNFCDCIFEMYSFMGGCPETMQGWATRNFEAVGYVVISAFTSPLLTAAPIVWWLAVIARPKVRSGIPGIKLAVLIVALDLTLVGMVNWVPFDARSGTTPDSSILPYPYHPDAMRYDWQTGQ